MDLFPHHLQKLRDDYAAAVKREIDILQFIDEVKQNVWDSRIRRNILNWLITTMLSRVLLWVLEKHVRRARNAVLYYQARAERELQPGYPWI